MNISEDELEQRLRALFADERLDVPPPPEAERGIVAGARRRRRRRQGVLTAAGVAAAVVVVAGGLAVVRLHTTDGTAVMSAEGTGISARPHQNPTTDPHSEPALPAPSGAPAATTSPQLTSRTPKPSAAKPSSVVPPVASGPLLSPDGFGHLKLGMSEAEVNAQGVTLTDPQPGATCTTYTAQGTGVPAAARVVISKAAGLTAVTPEQAAHTTEGVGAGSTKAQVLAAYPEAKDEPGGVVAPAVSDAEYHFRLTDAGVVQTSLTSLDQDCAG